MALNKTQAWNRKNVGVVPNDSSVTAAGAAAGSAGGENIYDAKYILYNHLRHGLLRENRELGGCTDFLGGLYIVQTQ